MSGIEIAGLVFGVVPIVVEILKSYRTAKERLNTFRKYGRVIHDVQLRYRVAATSFSNDCQLLLKAVVNDARELPEMLEDPNHDAWRDPHLEPRFRTLLAQDYKLFEDIVILIRNVLRDTQTALQECEGQTAGGDTQSAIAKRFYAAFNISRKENEYRRWLDTLDQWNNKLSELRKQRCKLHKRRFVRSSCLVRKAVPRKYKDIQATSRVLHESLQDSWSCTNISHTGHQGKLSVEGKAEYGNVRLDMVISCRENDANMDATQSLQEPPIWLHVQTISTPAPAAEAVAPTANILGAPKVSVQRGPLYACASQTKSTIKRELKTVRFDTADSENERVGPEEVGESDTSQPRSFATLDLKATKSICDHLSRSCALESHCADTCLGYLEYPGATLPSRLIFYDASKNAAMQRSGPSKGWEALPINKLLQSLQILHQLTLARSLAVAMLQYHSTSWLAPDWRLQDVSYFDGPARQQTDIISDYLQSLHLSTHFSGSDPTEPMEPPQNPQDLKYMYGIRNLPLAKLGVALLEIGCQKEISSLNGCLMPHDVISARKVLLNPLGSLANLGNGYLTTIRKCIECDFSCGDDLSNSDLQDAVYTEVICGLESQIKAWKKFRGID